jgi:hypothetical protein
MVNLFVGPRPSIRFRLIEVEGLMDREIPYRYDEAALMRAAAAGIDHVAQALLAMHQQWKRSGAPADALDWLSDLTGELGWWSGRLTGASSRPPRATRSGTSCLRSR